MKLALCLFKYFPYGGMQRDFLRIANLLANEYSVEVFTTDWQGEIPANITINKINVTSLTNHRQMQDFAKKALAKAKQRHCDVIMGFNKIPGLDIYFAADNCYVATAREKHGLLYRLTSRYRTYAALEKSVFVDKNTKILVLTTQQKKSYQHIYQTAEERFYVLPAEFNRSHHSRDASVIKALTQEIRDLHGIPSHHHMVLMVCAAFKTKGVDRALRALSQLDATLLSKTHLLIVGGEQTNFWLNLAKRLNVAAQVQFLGAKQNVSDYMCAADIFLHPARQEAGGKVILEAMSCGLPVLTTAECGYAEHVDKAQAGVLLSQKNIDKLLPETLSFMLTHPDKSAFWRERALDYVANYPEADLATEAVAIIKNISNSHDRNH